MPSYSVSPLLARAMGEAGRAHACDRFTWQRVAQQVLAVYWEVLNAPRTSAPGEADGSFGARPDLAAAASLRGGMYPSTPS